MSTSVYKLFYMKSTNIQKVIVFIGGRIIENKKVDVNALYKLEPENKIFKDIFSKEEKSQITNSEIVFSPMEIHLDDTIETVKKKYILASNDSNLIYSGLYLYTKIEKNITPTQIYDTLTESGQFILTKDKLTQYLLNMDGIDISKIPEQDSYTYNDIIALDILSNKSQNVAVPLGQKFHKTDGYYNFVSNPFMITEYDKLLIRNSNEILATTNQNLLMDTQDIVSNNIYACHVEDVLSYVSNMGLSQDNAISLYYPYLREIEIFNLSDYASKKENLITETNSLVGDTSWLTNIENIDLFYNLSNSYSGDKLILNEGIKHAEISLEPTFHYNIPLDVVFKLIHATEKVPMIKYNPSGRQEKIYRLYTDKVTANGRKIPMLSKGTIFRLMKVIAKNKEVSVYIETDTDPVVLSFFEDGRIEVIVDFTIARSIEEVNVILNTVCNPIIETISEYLEQRGYPMKSFQDIRNNDVIVSNITYVITSTLTKNINLKSIIKCVSSVFNVIDHDIVKGAVLRFKKVENYNEMDSMEAFIVESLNAGDRDLDIIKGLMDNFRIKNDTDAKKVLVDFVSRQQIIQQAFQNRKYKIKNNPGFLTLMVREKFEANLITTISGINNIGYLKTIPNYIKGLLIITQEPKSSSVPYDRISTLCSGSQINEEKKKEDVIAPVEEPTHIQSVIFKKNDEPDSTMQKGMLDMLIGDDDSDDDDEDDDDDDEDGGMDMMGGADSSDEEDIVKDITGLSLSNPNPFSDRLIKREPKLFLTNAGPGFSSYSRSCPSSNRRQPVILTQDEKDKIDKEHPGSYEHSLSYKSSPDTPTYHYICPRYWSLTEGVSLTQEDVDSGKYKKIIPHDAKSIPPGAGIYEFDSEYHRNDKGEYIGTQPGFMKPSKHPDGKCVPCCFKGWDTPSQIKLREKCQGVKKPTDASDVLTTGKKKKKLKITTSAAPEKFDEYVKGPEKFPLESGRIGYLPVTIQRFLNIDNRECQISSQNTNIKKNKPCLVRIGIEKNTKQSFIAAVASVYADNLPRDKSVPTINEMKGIMLNALDIDLFITLQNGNLIDMFDDGRKVNLELYKDSRIYKKTNTNDPSQLEIIKKISRSYENYREYLKNTDVVIGYEYIWDLLCFNNENLFEKGLNIVIIESKEDDITGNVGVICPSNHYSNSYFDVNKRVVIFIKRGEIYEPIISYEDKGTQYVITRSFSLKYRNLLPSLKEFLDTIKKSLDKCSPLPSMPKIYKFKPNITLDKMVNILKNKKYSIKSQLLNYSGKVIALDVSKGSNTGMVPVYPSAPSKEDIPYEWIDNYNGEPYEDTIKFLNFIYKDTKGAVSTSPALKAIDNNLIVGIITQTNQFVPIDPPTQDTYGDDLEIIEDVNYIQSDKTSLTDKNIDDERLKYMRRIKLETGFFNTFRNLVRMLLGEYKHQSMRAKLQTVVDEDKLSYKQKLIKVHEILTVLLSKLVNFTSFDDNLINEIDNVTNCSTFPKDKCDDKSYCLTTKDNCILLIPKQNLINGIDNEEMYYGRMADEIVRYSRIRSFIFEPKSFLSFSDVKYNLRENEVILLHTLLNQDYFDNLIPSLKNEHIIYNTYDTAQPIISQPYNNIVTKDKTTTIACEKPTVKPVTGKWIKSFPSGSNELIFSNVSEICTFDVITTIIEDYLGEKKSLTVEQVKETLANEYSSIYDEYSRAILGTFRIEGKTVLAQKLEMDTLDIGNAIMNGTYYLTPLDIWIISNSLNIPVVLYSNSIFLENKKNIIVCNTTGSNDYYFIKVPSIKQGTAPNYSLLVNAGKSLITTADMGVEMLTEINRQQRVSDELLTHFLETFTPPKKKKLKIMQPQDTMQPPDTMYSVPKKKKLKIMQPPDTMQPQDTMYSVPKKMKGKIKLVM